jgi:hypothetical protein
MSDAAAGWSQIVQEWLVDPGHCYAAGLASTSDYQYYAAAPVAKDKHGWDGWEYLLKADYQTSVQGFHLSSILFFYQFIFFSSIDSHT